MDQHDISLNNAQVLLRASEELSDLEAGSSPLHEKMTAGTPLKNRLVGWQWGVPLVPI